MQVWESKCQDDEEIPTTQVLFIEKTCHVTRLVNRILKVQSAIRNSGLQCGPKASELSIPAGSPRTQGGLWLVRFRVLAVRVLCGEVAAVSLHHHPAQCERKVGSLRWSLLTICLTRAGIGPW